MFSYMNLTWNMPDNFDVKITGTLGVIIAAKPSGHMESVKPILDKIKKTDFRLTSELEKMTLEKSNEA